MSAYLARRQPISLSVKYDPARNSAGSGNHSTPHIKSRLLPLGTRGLISSTSPPPPPPPPPHWCNRSSNSQAQTSSTSLVPYDGVPASLPIPISKDLQRDLPEHSSNAKKASAKLFKQFSFRRIPSHVTLGDNPRLYSRSGDPIHLPRLRPAFQPRSPRLLVVGDGEAETGPLPEAGIRTNSSIPARARCSAILHLHGYRSPPHHSWPPECDDSQALHRDGYKPRTSSKQRPENSAQMATRWDIVHSPKFTPFKKAPRQ